MPGDFPSFPDQGLTSRMIDLTYSTVDVTTSQTTTSTSYADLATTGPAATISPGVSQDHRIAVSAVKSTSSAGANNFASVAVAGASALDVDADEQSGATGHQYNGLRIVYAPAQASGATHTMKYKVSGGTGTFLNRRVVAEAI